MFMSLRFISIRAAHTSIIVLLVIPIVNYIPLLQMLMEVRTHYSDLIYVMTHVINKMRPLGIGLHDFTVHIA